MSEFRFEPYRPRPVRPLGLWRFGDWRIKAYGIAAAGERPGDILVEEARAIAERTLPRPAVEPTRYGLGYAIVHEGKAGDYVFVDWWTDQDIVQHHPFGRPAGGSGPLQPGWPPGAGFCVWELAVCWHEREAWVGHVLGRADAPDFEAYLADWLDRDV